MLPRNREVYWLFPHCKNCMCKKKCFFWRGATMHNKRVCTTTFLKDILQNCASRKTINLANEQQLQCSCQQSAPSLLPVPSRSLSQTSITAAVFPPTICSIIAACPIQEPVSDIYNSCSVLATICSIIAACPIQEPVSDIYNSCSILANNLLHHCCLSHPGACLRHL